MKVKLTTIREFPDKFFHNFITAINKELYWLDWEIILKEGKQEYSSTEEIVSGVITSATTKIEILEEDNANQSRS